MKNCTLLIAALLAIAFFSCDGLNSTEKKSKNIKNGIVKQYRTGNILKNEISLKDGKRHGMSKNYYKDGKSVHQQIEYKMGKKHGEAITYYENGNVYQITPYVEGEIDGIRKKYRENGKILSEIPYRNGLPCKGLKEYLLDGTIKKQYPKIVFSTKDNILKNGKYELYVKMSDNSKKVDFYVNGRLTKEGCIAKKVGALSNYKPGVLRLTYNLPPNAYVMEEVLILAVATTKLGNPYITTAKYNLAIENRGF